MHVLPHWPRDTCTEKSFRSTIQDVTSEPTRTATRHQQNAPSIAPLGLVLVYHPDRHLLGVSCVPSGEPLVLGRESDDFPAAALKDERISRRHFSVQQRGDGLWLTDLRSRNGTTHNGQAVKQAQLRPGDVVGAGFMLFLVQPVATQEADHGSAMVGQSVSLMGLAQRIARFGPTDTCVLILGEAGVGKELVARDLHRHSERRGAFVAVNCATLADGVVQSELFGHVRGAFSGSTGARRGLVERARGGTLFLDEIGDASPLLQVNLLRLLQEREFRPVGSDRTLSADVRFVAATNRPLARAVREGTFREDLYSRLARVTLPVPPLRERRADILPLVRHFLARAGQQRPLSCDLALALLRHDWPGNVRALEGIAERLIIEAPSSPTFAHPPWLDAALASHARLAADAPAQAVTAASPSGRKRARRPSAAALQDALRAHDGNVTALAREMGVARNTIYRWLERYSMAAEDQRDPGAGH